MNLATFIVPTLNRSSLRRTIESIYDQDRDDWEAIVAGDGVFPSYAMAVKREREGDNALRAEPPMVLGKITKRGSAGLVRNYCMDRYQMQSGPRSNYFAFVDDDDWLSPHYLSTLSQYAYSTNEMPDVIVFKMDHPVLGVLPRVNEVRHGNVGISFAVRTSIMYGLDFIKEDLNNEGPKGNEDIELLLRLESAGCQIVWSPHILYHVGNTRTVRS